VASNDSEPDRQIVDAVEAVRAGNANAYATVVKRFQTSIMNLCFAVLRDRQAAEELAQDVFVRAYERLVTFDVRRTMKPWLVKIAYRLAQQRWRTQASEAARRQAAAEMTQPNQNGQGPDERLLAAEQSETCGKLYLNCRWPSAARWCFITARTFRWKRRPRRWTCRPAR